MNTAFGLEALATSGVVAILRSNDSRHLARTAETLIDAGIRTLEFSLTTPGAAKAISSLQGTLGDGVFLGAGTVLDAAAAAEVIEAGAAFLVTPAVEPSVLGASRQSGVPTLCGAYTATEVLAAVRGEALAVKIFPAGAAGPAYCRALREPLPTVPLVPTGGITLDNAAEFIDAGATAVGIAGALIGDAAAGGSQHALATRVARLLDTIQAAQSRSTPQRGDRRQPDRTVDRAT